MSPPRYSSSCAPCATPSGPPCITGPVRHSQGTLLQARAGLGRTLHHRPLRWRYQYQNAPALPLSAVVRTLAAQRLVLACCSQPVLVRTGPLAWPEAARQWGHDVEQVVLCCLLDVRVFVRAYAQRAWPSWLSCAQQGWHATREHPFATRPTTATQQSLGNTFYTRYSNQSRNLTTT